MTRSTATILFAGGGGVEAGFSAAGIDCVQRVEFDADIAAVNEANFGPGVICAPVQSVDISKLSPTDYLWASPPCQQHSVARSNKLAARDDGDVGIHILDYVQALKPRAVCIENVPGYKDAPVFAAILHGLHSAGYRTQWSIVNAADWGVPQTRKRLILRAVRSGEILLPLTATHAKDPEPAGLFGPALLPWNGWYGAIEDILDTLPESAFAPWQLARLPEELFGSILTDSCVNTIEGRQATCRTSLDPAFTIKASTMRRTCTIPKALLIEGDAAGDRPPTCGTSAEPAFTLKNGMGGGRVHRAFLCGVQGEAGELARDGATPSPTVTSTHGAGKYRAFVMAGNSNERSWGDNRRDAKERFFGVAPGQAGRARAGLEQGVVRAMTPRALARFQSFPDTYALPAKNSLASKIIGNAVCPDLAEAIARTLPGLTNKQGEQKQ